jgi:Tho1/MOS11 C-terminal domain
VQGLSEKEKK